MSWVTIFDIALTILLLIVAIWVYFVSNHGKYILGRHFYLSLVFWLTIFGTIGWLQFINWNYKNGNNNLILLGRKIYGVELLVFSFPQVSSYLSWRYIKNITDKTNYEKDYVFKMNKQNPELAYKIMFAIIAIFLFISIYQTIDNRCFGCNNL